MLEAFTAGLLLITASEIGDKTFFMAVILASRYPRKPVFTGVTAALAAMTILSVALGRVLVTLPQLIASYLPPNWGFLTQISLDKIAALLFFLFGIKLLYSARSMTEQTDVEVMNEAVEEIERGEKKFKKHNTDRQIFIESCVLTFIAEWGDRTQVATIALAAAQNPIGVTLGGIVGHTICALIAVIGGRAIASHISERTITIIGGLLFILFAVVALVAGR